MMNFRKSRAIIFVVLMIISVAFLSHSGVEATRMLPAEDFTYSNHLRTDYSSVYRNAKSTMACWIQRLASGPSPRGRGH
ncbi:hypothetical protein EV1_031637 [Malus domestica]